MYRLQIDGETRGGILARMNSSASRDTENVEARGGWRGGCPTIDFFAKTFIPRGAQLLGYSGAEYFRLLTRICGRSPALAVCRVRDIAPLSRPSGYESRTPFLPSISPCC